jgi:uncharacterized protein
MLAKIRTLYLTGENNHDWTRSAPFCRDLLESSGRFSVNLTEHASQSLEDIALVHDTELFFVDYNGRDWSEEAKANFEKAVSEGAGVVVLHAANNGFAGWTAMEEMAAIMWREGAGHGAYHEFTVRIIDHEHPITRGLSDFQIWDELYHRLTHMHGVPHTVLATAYSDPETGGSSAEEPMMLVTQYGKGRVFHQVLGHIWPHDFGGGYKGFTLATYENEGFQRSLLRGSEWAATGIVTLE